MKLLWLTVFLLASHVDSTDVIGNWRMLKVIQDGKDVSAEHNPHQERKITFSDNGTFRSSGRPYGTNTGRYYLKDDQQQMFLDSDAGPEDDSSWRIKVRNDTMFWTGIGSEWATRFELQFVRVKS